MYKTIKNYDTIDSLIDVKLSSAVGVPGWNQEFSCSLSRVHDYIHSISGLPPSNMKNARVKLTLLFNDLAIIIRSDSTGTYRFINPLPVSLLPYESMQIIISVTVTDDRKDPFPYSNIIGTYSDSKVALDKYSVINMKIRSYENGKIKDDNFIIRDGIIIPDPPFARFSSHG